MPDVFDVNDWDPYNGFKRASVSFGSRKPYRPEITANDLLMPSGFGNARMAGMCVVMAFCMAVLYVWPVLFVVNLAVPLRNHLFSWLFLGAVLAFFLFLYFAGSRETRRDRELATKL
jgi:hypothetical protein